MYLLVGNLFVLSKPQNVPMQANTYDCGVLMLKVYTLTIIIKQRLLHVATCRT